MLIREKEFGHYFPVRETTNEWAISKGLGHEILIRGAWDDEDAVKRFAEIKKTVACVAVDEDENGAICHKWFIQHVEA